jgi:hypothetical protein
MSRLTSGWRCEKSSSKGASRADAEAERQADADVAARRQALLGDIGLGGLDQVEDDPALLEIGRARPRSAPAGACCAPSA